MRFSQASLVVLSVFWVFGCGDDAESDSLIPGSEGGSPSGDDEAGDAGGGEPADPSTVAFPKECSDIYDPETVPEFELELDPSELSLLEEDCEAGIKQYRPATFRYGVESAEVMVRLKGNWSFRCEKKQFVISFNELDPDGRFHGQRKLVLDAPWYDPSLLAERLGFSFMRRTGSPWSCVNNARLVLNGEYYGAYANVEHLDKEYLQRHFPDDEADGNLYEAGTELKTNEDTADTSRQEALMAATTLEAIEELVHLEEAVQVWASSAMLPDPDSYWAGVEINYYIYDHPTRGFLWFPYDMDLTMRQGIMNEAASSVDIGVVQEFVEADPFTYENPAWGREPIYQIVLSDPYWCARFLDALAVARDAYDVASMTDDLETWATQIADAVREDPNRLYSEQDHLDGIATLKAFMPARLAFVEEWLRTASCPITRWSR